LHLSWMHPVTTRYFLDQGALHYSNQLAAPQAGGSSSGMQHKSNNNTGRLHHYR